MPEGHTLHKAARKQGPALIGQVVRASSPQGRFTDAALLDHARIVDIEAFGKHLLYRFEKRRATKWLHVHLGLAGRFALVKTPASEPRTSVRLRMVAANHTLDLRGPLICEVVGAERAAEIVDALGPDPIRNKTVATKFAKRVARTKIPIGALLLDQSVIAGVGNVYRAEILWLARIDPRRPSNSLTGDEVKVIWSLARSLMRAGVTDGRIVTTKYGDVPPLHPKQRTYAYKQAYCARCSGLIHNAKLAGRPCFYCPACQQ